MEVENLIESFSEFKEVKNINRETMMNILEDVFKAVLAKKYNEEGDRFNQTAIRGFSHRVHREYHLYKLDNCSVRGHLRVRVLQDLDHSNYIPCATLLDSIRSLSDF